MTQTEKIVRISELIIPKFWGVFNDEQHMHKILTSGRAGTKSSEAAIEVVFKIIRDLDGSAVVIRKRHNKLRKTVYKEILRAIRRLGLDERLFKITVSPMEVTYLDNHNTIYFTGSDNIDDTKGIIDDSKPIKLVMLDELTEFFEEGEGEDELINIEATFARGNHGNFQMLYLYNPPKNPNAAVNKWCRKMEQRDDCIHVHTDYRDVPPEWLGPDLIASAEALKRQDEKRYRWVWLGQPVGVDEMIYYMFGDRYISRPHLEKYRVIGIGGDYGQQNATTYQAFGLDEYDHRLDGLAEFYHSGRDSGHQKSPSQYARALIEMVNKLHLTYGCGIFYVFLDPSAKGLNEEIKRSRSYLDDGIDLMLKDAENDVALGIDRVQKLFTYDRLSISPDQANAIEEFGTYEYDKKSIERGKEQPVKVDDHAMDAIRYLVMGFWKYIKGYLPEKGKKSDLV